MQTPWMRYVWALVALGVLAAIAVLISMSAPSVALSPQSAPVGFPKYAPPPRGQDAVTAQKGFDALVSFTGGGFQPATIVIKTGETIRFSNNASTDLQITSQTSSLFSKASSIAPRNYAEITFTAVGRFQYSTTQSGRSGTIIVQ